MNIRSLITRFKFPCVRWSVGTLLCMILLVLGTKFSSTLLSSEKLPVRLQDNRDGTITLLFQGTPGARYRIEFTDSLSDQQTGWTVAAADIVAGHGWSSWVDQSAAFRSQRFYRVVPLASEIPDNRNASPAVVSSTPPVLNVDKESADSVLKSADALWSRIKEDADAGRLVGALSRGDIASGVDILREYGLHGSVLDSVASRFGQAPRAYLNERFVRAVVSLPLEGKLEEMQERVSHAAGRGFERQFLVVTALEANWQAHYDQKLAMYSVAPIAALNVKLEDGNLIRFFQWYDRYAERLHSVAINWECLSNWDTKHSYSEANRVMSTLFHLIKARKPDAFVWARVVWEYDHSDQNWLKALKFRPDGLIVWGLPSFSSPFQTAQTRYLSLLGQDTPLLLAEFFGHYPEFPWSHDSSRDEIGKIVVGQLQGLEAKLEGLGYRGFAPNWQVVAAIP